jgi:hypothetical protein
MAHTADPIPSPQALRHGSIESLRILEAAPADELRVRNTDDQDEREDTELTQVRRNYTLTSSRQQGTPSARKPSTLWEHATYAVASFWKHQISLTVPHVMCRDHLGRSLELFISFFQLDTCSLPRLVGIASLVFGSYALRRFPQ